jgi:hypothetical protein
MSCEKYRILINDLIEGEADSQIADEVNLHVFACRSCEAEYEMLRGEKEMYSHFLFEIEPPTDLSARFQARLKAENQREIISVTTRSRFAGIFDLFGFKPILAGAVAVAVIGIGCFWLKTATEHKEKIIASQPQTPDVSPIVKIDNTQVAADNTTLKALKTPKVEPVPQKRFEKQVEQISVIKATLSEEKLKVTATNVPRIKKPIIRRNKLQNFVQLPKISAEEDANFKQIQAFEIETAKQMEKVEMLLRAFRNVRCVEGGIEYDVAFEKQQASKLLAKNVQLREQSENYGTIPANEMLRKVEPYLLDISNLDANPSEEEVLEIKQRVKNQNIIVSLQSF